MKALACMSGLLGGVRVPEDYSPNTSSRSAQRFRLGRVGGPLVRVID